MNLSAWKLPSAHKRALISFLYLLLYNLHWYFSSWIKSGLSYLCYKMLVCRFPIHTNSGCVILFLIINDQHPARELVIEWWLPWAGRSPSYCNYCIALHCIALYCITLHCLALHCIVLHCMALDSFLFQPETKPMPAPPFHSHFFNNRLTDPDCQTPLFLYFFCAYAWYFIFFYPADATISSTANWLIQMVRTQYYLHLDFGIVCTQHCFWTMESWHTKCLLSLLLGKCALQILQYCLYFNTVFSSALSNVIKLRAGESKSVIEPSQNIWITEGSCYK